MNVALAGAAWVLPLAGGMLVISTLLIMWRLLVGPSRPDRAVAVDALTMIGVAGVSVLAMMSEQAVLLDVAIVLAIVSFLGSVAFALLFKGTHSSDNPHGQPERPVSGIPPAERPVPGRPLPGRQAKGGDE